VALAVIAAPLFEEFIFRGLVFGGMRRSLGAAHSILFSAAIFAIVHPPVALVPVFVLGAIAALVYDRGKLLIGSMTAHAFYNGVMVFLQR
jgi:membrane protease YdiL (CAAX protease family)